LQIEEAIFTEIPFDNWDIQNQNYLGSIIQFIYEKFGLFDEQDENTADIAEDDRVLVTTMYSAKGLEAEFVFMMWLNDKIIPMTGRDVKEQLRVLYVGMTRAKQDVIFTFHEKFDGSKRVKHEAMSPFLQKIISFLEVRRIMKSSL
jgi:superfamily I DNA/RNA helicase